MATKKRKRYYFVSEKLNGQNGTLLGLGSIVLNSVQLGLAA